MASEIRVNRLSNRSGLSTITFANGGVQFSGITTFANGEFYVGTGATIINPGTNEFNFHTGGSNRFTINNSGANLGTGNITAVDATFTGNVSIGKTLTYEDVKNVDSVGVVTARTGVKVTGGDFTVGTAITASSVTGNVTNDVGITTYSGSAVWFKGATANKDMYWSHASGSLVFKDTARILVGDGSDLQIHHTSGNSFIENSTGTFKLRGATVEISNPSAAQMVLCTSGAGVNLYYSGNKKFETVSSGAQVTGSLGIGVAPNRELHVKGLDAIVRVESTSATGRNVIEFFDSSAAKGSIGWPASGNDHMAIQQVENADMWFSTNDTERLRITSAGLIGAGLAAPVAQFQINSTKNAETDRHDATNYHLALRNPADDNGEAIGLSFGITSNTTKVGAAILHERDGGGSTGSLQFYTSPDGNGVTERLRIASDGVVWAKDGKIRLGTTSGTDSYIYSSNAAGIIYQADDNGHKFQTYSGSWQTRLTITDGGSIGMGIASPVSTTKLHISKGWNNSTATTSSAVNLLISNNASAGDWSVLGFQAGNTGGSAIYFGDTDLTNAGFIDYYHQHNRLVYGAAGAERLRIESDGRILVAGADNYHGDADDLVLKERSGSNVGITLQNTGTGYGVIYFADSGAQHSGRIQYDHSNDSLDLFTGGGERFTLTEDGATFNCSTASTLTYTFQNGTSGASADTRVLIKAYANSGADPYIKFDAGGSDMVVGTKYEGTTNNKLVLGAGSSPSGGVAGIQINGSGHVLPDSNNTRDLGSTGQGWRNVYMNDLQLSNVNGDTNDVDGTQGTWTIQEGSDDLFLINRLNGKKYRFNLTEVS